MKTKKWIAALIPLALMIPTLGRAATGNAYDLDPANGTFDPRIDVITAPFADQITKVWPVINETKDHDPAVQNTIVIPGGYRFSIDSIKPAGKRATPATPATSCSDLITGTGQQFTTAEVFTNAVGDKNGRKTLGVMKIMTDNTRPNFAVYYGELAYLNTVSGVATLCAHYVTGNSAIPAASRDLLFPLTLQRNNVNDWELTYDLGPSVYNTTYYNGAHTNVIQTEIPIEAVTMGNWNRNTSNQLTPVTFAKSPIGPGNYTFHDVATTCTLTGPGMCQSDKGTVTADKQVAIATGYSPGIHLGSIFSAPAPFSLFRNLNANPSVKFDWTPPATSSDHLVKAFGISIGIPQLPTTVHYETVPASSACDTTTHCSASFSFPLAVNATPKIMNSLPRDGKYSISIVTIYADGHRSDGKCDDGTQFGYPPLCAGETTFPQQGDGGVKFHSLEFMTRSEAWPLAFQGGSLSGSAKDLLLVDYSTTPAKMQYTIWQANNPQTLVYSASSAGVEGDNATGAGTVIANVQASGSTQGLSLALVIDPFLGASGTGMTYNLAPAAPGSSALDDPFGVPYQFSWL